MLNNLQRQHVLISLSILEKMAKDGIYHEYYALIQAGNEAELCAELFRDQATHKELQWNDGDNMKQARVAAKIAETLWDLARERKPISASKETP